MRRDYIKEALDMGRRHFKDKQEIVMPIRREINAYMKEYWCEDKEDRHKEKMLYDKMCLACGKMTGGYSRAGKVVKESHLYKSGCCKAKIVVTQNW